MTPLLDILHRFHRARLLVVGDLMLDRFIWGDVERISPEAPVPVMRVMAESYRLGGAANVIHNVLSLGANLRMPIDKFYDAFWETGLLCHGVEPHVIREVTGQTSIPKPKKHRLPAHERLRLELGGLLARMKRNVYVLRHYGDFHPAARIRTKPGNTARIK